MKYSFDYCAPRTLAEALDYLQQPSSMPYAGGTDLLVGIRNGKHRPGLLCDLKGIDELHLIAWEERHLRVGACVIINRLKSDPLITAYFPVLATAAQGFGCSEIRNRATIGGNIANAAPCAQTAPPLAVLDALVEVASGAGKRLVPFADFITGVGKTSLEPQELITAFLVPRQPTGSVGLAYRAARVRGMDLPSVNLAVHVIHADEPQEREIRFCLGSVAIKPTRFPDLEAQLSRRKLTRKTLEQACRSLESRITPRAGSLRASPAYKKTIASYLLQQALAELLMQPRLSPEKGAPA